MTPEREAIERAFAVALRESDPRRAVREQFLGTADGAHTVSGTQILAAEPIEAFAVGKAAAAMMLGALDALGDRLQRGFVLTKDGLTSAELPGSIYQTVAAHPVLDERSLAATQELIDWLAVAPPGSVTLCLISGGGSALLELPIQGVPLADFQLTTRLLLNAGADISRLNAVRSQISRVKGGRLRALIPGRVVNLIVSDVLGNDVAVIASGPTVPPRSTPLDALRVINGLGLAGKLPSSVQTAIASAMTQFWVGRLDDVTRVIADNEHAISAAAVSLHHDGFLIERSPLAQTGEASQRAREFVQWLASLPPTVTGAIGGGEYTVNVTGSGVGGRNTEFALAAALELDRLGCRDWTVASLATDGDDAMTAVAGGIVDSLSASEIKERGHDPAGALGNNDSLAALEAIGATHVTGPTGTNVNDLYLAARLMNV